MRECATKVLHESGAETADGQGPGLHVDIYKEATFFLNVSQYSGFTSVEIKIIVQDPVSSEYHDLATFTTVTGVTKEMKAVAANLGHRIRCKWTVNGSGSITFSLSAVLKD